MRLAAKLTGWRIDIKGAGEAFAKETANLSTGQFGEIGLSRRTVSALTKAGIVAVDQLKSKTAEELRAIEGLGPKALSEIEKALSDLGAKAEDKEKEAVKPAEDSGGSNNDARSEEYKQGKTGKSE